MAAKEVLKKRMRPDLFFRTEMPIGKRLSIKKETQLLAEHGLEVACRPILFEITLSFDQAR